MGMPKQMLQVGGVNLLDRVLDQALNSVLDLVVLVLGSKAQEIKKSLVTDFHHPKLKVIENRNYRDGISTSIIAGLSAVEEKYDHCMVILADMPHITSNLINLLVHQYLDSRFPLAAIKAKERRSHPVIIGRPLYDELHRLKGDVGARDLFREYPDQVCLVDPQEDYDDTDIDTLKEYHEFMKSLGNGSGSSAPKNR